MPLLPPYRNPVHAASLPDPFVLKHRGTYWAFGTGRAGDGRLFPVLRSPDLVRWEDAGGALAPPGADHPCWWAPEAARLDGRFFLYYSVGNEARMEIRAAVSSEPGGPYEDCGRALTSHEFAIDPHVFVDDDGSRWLFYATDFLEHSRIGTGTVADRLIDPITLAGRPRPVSRARYEWQLYDPRRAEKGNVRWYTVEGPAVLKRRGLYYQMFSGGNWKNVTYGVSYATSPRLDALEEWEQASDGDTVLPVLRTLPGKVVGPGHNSVVRGPDNRQLWCVYHVWSEGFGERRPAIDRLEWIGPRLSVLGPTVDPQPAPNPASVREEVLAGGIVPLQSGSFLAEVWADAPLRVVLAAAGEERWATEIPAGSHLRLDRSGRLLRADRDGVVFDPGVLQDRVDELRLDGPAYVEATWGFEDLLDGDRRALGWDSGGAKPLPPGDLEIVANACWGHALFRPLAGGPALAVRDGRLELGEASVPLPEGFDPARPEQLRCTLLDRRLEVRWENGPALFEQEVPVRDRRAVLGGPPAAFDLVRATTRGA